MPKIPRRYGNSSVASQKGCFVAGRLAFNGIKARNSKSCQVWFCALGWIHGPTVHEVCS